MCRLYKIDFPSSHSSVDLMANKDTQEGQCQSGTADLAESVLNCLSTGMKITVVFVLVVVFFTAISAMAASSVIPPGSAFSAASSGRQPDAPVVSMGDPPEVSGDPGPSASSSTFNASWFGSC